MVEILESGRRNIVVLGAGFGGITALLKLEGALKRRGLLGRFNLILVNRNSQHLYSPMLYEIAAIPSGKPDAAHLSSGIVIPIEDIIRRLPSVRFIGEEVGGLDPRTHRILFKSGNQLNFEYAVIALGSETNFFDIPGLAAYSCPLKTFEDALRLRNRIEELVRTGPGALRIVVGGGGATGVELSAEFVNFLCYVKKRAAAGKCQEEITLLEASPEILSGFGAGVLERARRRLQNLGVSIVTAAPINRVTQSEIMANGRTLPYDLLIWTGGVKPVAVLNHFNLPLDEKGGIIVNEYLEARPRIYAVGDAARFVNPKTGKPLPANVPVAESEARLVAKNIVADISASPKRRFRPMMRYPFILAVGGRYAVADLVFVKCFGFAGWVLKQLVELRYLLFILPWGKAVRMWIRALHSARARS